MILYIDDNLAWPRLVGIEPPDNVSEDSDIEARDSTEFNTLISMYCPPDSYYFDYDLMRIEPVFAV